MGRVREGADPRAWLRVSTLVRGAAFLALLAPVAGTATVPPGQALSRAHEAIQKGDRGRAIEVLAPLASSGVADHAALLRCRLLREEGELRQALDAARSGLALDPPSEVKTELYREETRTQLARGDILGAYRAQRSAWETTRSSKRLEVAEAFDEALLPGDALTLYRLVWTRWPLTDAAERAWERAERLEKATGASSPGTEALLGFAGALRTTGRCDFALGLYDRVLATEGLEPEMERRAEYGRADCLFALRRYEEAAGAYGVIVAEDSEEIRASIDLARSHARNGDVSVAVRQLDAVAKRADRIHSTRASYLAAILAGPPEQPDAAKRLRKIESQKYARGYARSARWRLGWSDLRAGNYEAALNRLRPLMRGEIFDIEVQRALYWVSVAEIEVGKVEQGRAGLRRIAEKLPLSYYGFLSAARLQEKPPLGESFLSPPEPFSGPAVERAAQLLEAGFDDLASLELQSRVYKKVLTREERLSLSRLLHEVGDHFRAVRLMMDGFGGSLEQGIDPAWTEAWHLAWPRPFGPAVEEAAREFGADPALVYAVMREESHYRPDVVSPVGARGLMQIMPPTGQRIAEGLGDGSFEADRLFQPETNIRFASYYLRQLLQTFDGQRPLAIAAYNAGPEVVSSWARKHDPFALDTFVDSVPYSETRRYLRRVLRSYRVYELLYGEEREDSTRLNPEARADDSGGSE
jgi:soluble lytic murein transglycosylase